MASRSELLERAEAKAEWASRENAVSPLVAELEAIRLTVAASLEPAELVEEEEPPRWMCVELFGHQIVYGLAGEVFWCGRRWLEVAWPTIHDQESSEAVVLSEAGSKRYHPNAVYAMEEIGEDAVRKALTSRGGLNF